MKAIYTAWKDLPDRVIGRWLDLRPLLLACFARGLQIEIQDGDELQLPGLPDYMQGGMASYVRTRKLIALTSDVAYGLATAQYGAYRPDIHEVGHAVWALLLTPVERWVKYFLRWKSAKGAGRLLDDYSRTTPEEGWAQDFEAYFTEEIAGDWQAGRERLRRLDPGRFGLIAGIMRRLGVST